MKAVLVLVGILLIVSLASEGSKTSQEEKQLGEQADQFEQYLLDSLFEKQLRQTYETMSVWETWTNKPHDAQGPDAKISPLIRMRGAEYDGMVADPIFGNRPHPNMPTMTVKQARVSLVLAFVKEPDDLGGPISSHYADTMFMKNLHALAWTYAGAVDFAWVDYDKDPDLIAFTLGIDTLRPEFFPVMVLINGESVYVAPKQVTESYYNIAYFIEKGYKEQALTNWQLRARLGTFGASLKHCYRYLIKFLASYQGESLVREKSTGRKLRETEMRPVTYQQLHLNIGGGYLVQKAIRRLDQRETFQDWIVRVLRVGQDDYETIAFFVSPFLMCYLLQQYCCRSKDEPKLEEKEWGDVTGADLLHAAAGGDPTESDEEADRLCCCTKMCRRLNVKKEEFMTRDRLTRDLENELVSDQLDVQELLLTKEEVQTLEQSGYTTTLTMSSSGIEQERTNIGAAKKAKDSKKKR